MQLSLCRASSLFLLLLAWPAGAWMGCSSEPPPQAPSPSVENPPDAQPSPAWFRESARASGLDFAHSSGASGDFYFPEIMTGGVCLLDYDGDGFLDVYCVQGRANGEGEKGNRLYRNLGDGSFEDATDVAGVSGNAAYGMGCACGDYDGDGDTDLYVTNVGANTLYRNNGDRTFTDVTEATGTGHPGWGVSAAFVDYDRDGRLDLFVANYVRWAPHREIDCFGRGGLRDYCSPMNYQAPAVDVLYRNRGDGAFEDATRAAGLERAYGNGLGVVCADFDRDGWPDIYVANDAMPNQLWINQGDGGFVDRAMILGAAVNAVGMSEAGMGVAAFDLEDDGWPDLFMTHLEGESNTLYVNEEGVFRDLVQPQGPGATSWPFTGFGLGFADFDHDGWLDLYVANGKVKYGQREWDKEDPYAEPNQLLRGIGPGEFEELDPQGGVEPPLIAASRGLALGDLDNDGDIDAVVANRDGPAHLLENIASKNGNSITLRLVNSAGADAIGASVRLTVGGRNRWGWVQPNQSYASSSDPRIHTGLGPAEIVEKVTVFWPDGDQDEWSGLAANQIYELRRGAPRPSPLRKL